MYSVDFSLESYGSGEYTGAFSFETAEETIGFVSTAIQHISNSRQVIAISYYEDEDEEEIEEDRATGKRC